jgi:putative intracellular protease/amidase
VFRAVRDSRGWSPYEVRVCSLRQEVKSEYLTIKAPWRLSSVERAGTVIVPGIDSIDRPVAEKVLRVLRRAAARRVRVASICSGAFVLARTGALNGLKATTHWMVAQELGRRYPEIDVNPDVLYVDNGKLLTSAGAAAGFDLCLHFVRRDFGAEVAAQTARAAAARTRRRTGTVHCSRSANDCGQCSYGPSVALDRAESPERTLVTGIGPTRGDEHQDFKQTVSRTGRCDAGGMGHGGPSASRPAAPGNHESVGRGGRHGDRIQVGIRVAGAFPRTSRNGSTRLQARVRGGRDRYRSGSRTPGRW